MDRLPKDRLPRGAVRVVVLALGWGFVGVGVVGVFVPGLPTTVFLLVALWCFSRSSARFQHWLWTHPRLGPPLRAWHRERAIPRRGKVLAALTMAGSFTYLTLFVAEGWVLPLALAAVMAPAGLYVLTRPEPSADTLSTG